MSFITSRIALAACVCLLAGSQPLTADELERGFSTPPPEARPWVYWFWLNGNISSNGITADLEAMARVGIGGVLIMEVDQGAPVGPVDFMGSSWRNLFRHAAAEATRLGLEINMNNDAGWNGSGGPWIRPEQSMQKVVWTETNLAGPSLFEGSLAQPETVAGFYRDIAVLAFPTPGPARIENVRQKALYELAMPGGISEQTHPPEMVIDRDRILDLTAHLQPNGQLNWQAPNGQWTVLRLGHTSTGVENSPAPKTGRGLECDKLSREGIEANFAGMMALLAADTKSGSGGRASPRAQTSLEVRARGNARPPGQAGLVATHIDSWENGTQNWTARMREEFRARRGYDPLPFLPAMTGRIVGSQEISERFLWDLRRTISDMVVTNYAGRMRELAHAAGLRFTVEAYGGPCDNLDYGGQSDEPMGEFWSPNGAIETCKGMACAAHVYGKRIVGAEAFTAGDLEKWREYPATLKALGDRAFCEGINRFVFHRYALQPWQEDRRPGMTMGPWGQHYERTQTWWEQTRPWHDYLARCQFLLRQGWFVADICYLQGETPPHGFDGHTRQGYDWDECTAEAVISRMSVRDGRLTLPDGMSYRVLVLPATKFMTPQLLRKLSTLVEQGATVIGVPPGKSPSLTGYPQCDQEVRDLAAGLWGNWDENKIHERRLGKGRVVWFREPEKVLKESGVPPDFVSGQPLRFLHRATPEADIYFVANSAPRAVDTTGTFRVAHKAPELWWPDTGRLEGAPLWREHDGVTSVGLSLEPSGSVFVVFRKPSAHRAPAAELLRDGKLVLTAVPQPAEPVNILQASYGTLNNPAKTRDVREKVQRKVDGGEHSFPASMMAEGDDPAVNEVKTLAVEYVIAGKTYTVRAQDPATVHLTSNALKVVVEKARYGVLDDPKRTRDVRQKLQRLVDTGESAFLVSRMAEGDDPAVLVVKTLEVEYTLDGKRLAARGTDPEMIDLKPPPPDNREQIAEAVREKSGKLQVIAFRPGSYELRLADGQRRESEIRELPKAVEVSGPWSVRFETGVSAPTQATFDHLISWTSHADPAIRYFSGTAVYTTTVQIPRGMLGKGRRVYLDLGEVHAMAEVRINHHRPISLWKPPFRLDITDLAKPNENKLEVKVTNLWPNRLIGDEHLPEDSERNPDGTLKRWPDWLLRGKPSPAGRSTFTTWRLWKKTDAPLASGLLGPLRIVPAQEFSPAE